MPFALFDSTVFANLLFGGVLLVIAGALLRSQAIRWLPVANSDRDHDSQPGDAATSDPREHAFLSQRYRRRQRASSLIGVVGLAVIAGSWISHTLTAACYWSGVLLLVLWIVLLAITDALASLSFYQRHRQRQLFEQAALQAELKREIDRRRESPRSDTDGESDPPTDFPEPPDQEPA